MKHPNRMNARKAKKGSGCKMCKPHKGKWAHKFKDKERLCFAHHLKVCLEKVYAAPICPKCKGKGILL